MDLEKKEKPEVPEPQVGKENIIEEENINVVVESEPRSETVIDLTGDSVEVGQTHVHSARNRDIDGEWAKALQMKYDPNEAAPLAPPPIPGKTSTPPPYRPQPQFNPAPQPASPADSNPQTLSNAQPPVRQSQEGKPKTYLGWAIAALLCCAFIPGLVAILYAGKVNPRYYAGDINGAKRASELAQYWIIAAIVLGVIKAALYYPLMIAFM